mmetsp:Transcript_4527/g.5249  ORF Transcript_4527/g.5249 Transcript_4527/m.5249 type:complete len:232 (-) Transcript_4527:415-1110(-)
MGDLAEIYGEVEEDPTPPPNVSQISDSATLVRTEETGSDTPLLNSSRDALPEVENVGSNQTSSIFMRILCLVLVCKSEVSTYWKLTSESVQDRVSKYWVARHAFYVHWVTVVATLSNLVNVYMDHQHYDLMQLLIPWVYLFLAWPLGWALWTLPIVSRLCEPNSRISYWIHLVFFFHSVFAIIMLIGHRSLGIAGIIDSEYRPEQILNMLLWVIVLIWTVVLYKGLGAIHG